MWNTAAHHPGQKRVAKGHVCVWEHRDMALGKQEGLGLTYVTRVEMKDVISHTKRGSSCHKEENRGIP